MKNKKLLILISKSGNGKDCSLNYLVDKYGFKPLISHTTRPIRPLETNHVTYEFVSDDEFKQMISDNKLIEYRTYNTLVDNIPAVWFYGLSKQTVDNLDPNTNYVTIFDVQGTKDFIEYYGRDNCFVCMLKCDDKIREERAKLRGGFNQIEWNRRLLSDVQIFNDENTKGLVDHYITNEGTIEELETKLKELVETIS